MVLLNGNLFIYFSPYILVTFGNLYFFFFTFISLQLHRKSEICCFELIKSPPFYISISVCISYFCSTSEDLSFHLPQAEAPSELLPTPLCVFRQVCTVPFLSKSTSSWSPSICAQTAECPHSMVAGFPQRGLSKGQQTRWKLLYDPGLEGTKHHIFHSLFGGSGLHSRLWNQILSLDVGVFCVHNLK